MKESTDKFIELGKHKVTHIATGDTEYFQNGLLNVSSIESVVPEGLTDCIIKANGKEYKLNRTGYSDTVDKIKKNVSLEEFEKTVFEFTKALAIKEAPGDVKKRVFERAIDLAQNWYEGSEARLKAFQELTDTHDNGSEPVEKTEQSYGFAGERTY